MSTLQQNLQRPFYIKHLLERLRYGKAAVAMRREAADLIEKMNEDSSNLSAQNSYQAMRIEELQRDLAAAQQEAITAGGAVDILNQQLAAAQEARQRAEALAESYRQTSPIKAEELDVKGDLFGIRFCEGGSTGLIMLYIEDDQNWHHKATFDRSWLLDLMAVIQAARSQP